MNAKNMSSYAFSILKLHEDNSNKINFKNLNKGFYDEISSDDKKIKINKSILNKIKKITIKDLIKSHKIVPLSWRNNNSENEIINVFNNDKRFLSLSPPKNKNYGKLPKIKLIHHRNAYNNLKEEFKSENNRYFSPIRKLKNNKIKTKKELGNDNIKILLDNFRASYPIRESEINFSYNNNINRELSKGEHKTEQGINSSKKENYNFKMRSPSRHNIFSLVSPRKNKNNSRIFNNNFGRNSKIIEERNKTIEQNLKSIDYFGPYFSFCPSCRIKNLEFYKDMEFNQCLKLIHYIKNFRNHNNVHFGLKFPSPSFDLSF